jgi:hypothetical protein
MRSRKLKNLKHFALPLAFILGVASFPIGSMLMAQVKKATAAHAVASPKAREHKAVHAASSTGRGKASQGRKHHSPKAKSKVKNHRNGKAHH